MTRSSEATPNSNGSSRRFVDPPELLEATDLPAVDGVLAPSAAALDVRSFRRWLGCLMLRVSRLGRTAVEPGCGGRIVVDYSVERHPAPRRHPGSRGSPAGSPANVSNGLHEPVVCAGRCRARVAASMHDRGTALGPSALRSGVVGSAAPTWRVGRNAGRCVCCSRRGIGLARRSTRKGHRRWRLGHDRGAEGAYRYC